MAINKVVYGDDTLIDLTQDSVSAENLLEGETAHDRSGNPVTGTAKQGHILKNQAGTAMTQRANMVFKDAGLSDNSAGAATEVEIIHQLTKTQLEALGENTDGIYETTDEEDIPVGDIEEDYVEVTADGVKTFGMLLNEIWSALDISKINNKTVLTIGSDNFYLRRKQNTILIFSGFRILNTHGYYESAYLKSNDSSLCLATYTESSGDWVIDDETNDVVANNIKITLYYGTKSSIVELNTDAQHCIMSDGETNVEEAINEKVSASEYILEGTTTTSGALLIPNALRPYNFIALQYADDSAVTVGLIFRREYSYLTCLTNSLNPVSETTVKVKIIYI